MPGHCDALIASYPELGNFSEIDIKYVPTNDNLYNSVINVDEKTFEFLKNVFKEIVELFPFEYIHMGILFFLKKKIFL